MTIANLINRGKEQFYNMIYEGATAFPGSSDLMHAGLIGAMPFIAGKYGAEYLGNWLPALKEHSTLAGYACSALSEMLWQTVIESGSKYAYINPARNLRGVAETAIGAGLAHLITRLTK